MVILAGPVKRLALARLKAIAAGTDPAPPGTSALVSTVDRPIQIEFSEPPEPERICIFTTPSRSLFREVTAEDPTMLAETALIGFRIRVTELGDDMLTVDQLLGNLCTAVATAVVAPPVTPTVRVWLSACQQDGLSATPGPEPSVTATATLVFSAEAVAYAE